MISKLPSTILGTHSRSYPRKIYIAASLQDYPGMKSYMTTLANRARRHGISLKTAFLEAGVQDSTYYRAKQGRELRYETAKLVYDYITNASKNKTHKKEA